MPLHAGLAIRDNRYTDGDEFFLLLGKGAIREGSALHLEEGLVDTRPGGQELRVRHLSPPRHVLEFAHGDPPAAS